MKIPTELERQIANFLLSLPNIYDSDNQRAFVVQASLDEQLVNQIPFGKAPSQFVSLLISISTAYGRLSDGRIALEAILLTAQNYTGVDKRAKCEHLIEQLHAKLMVDDHTEYAEIISLSNIPKTLAQIIDEGKLSNLTQYSGHISQLEYLSKSSDAQDQFEAIQHCCSELFLHEREVYDSYLEPGRVPPVVHAKHKPPLSVSTLIPMNWGQNNYHLTDEIIRKLSLYSELIVFTIPTALCGDSSHGSSISVGANITSLMSLNLRYYNSLKVGRVIVLPQRLDIDCECSMDYVIDRYIAPYYQEELLEGYFLLNSANQSTCNLDILETLCLYKELLIPYFPGISLEDLLKIKRNESEAFSRFQYFLRRKLSQIKGIERQQAFSELFEEIEYEVLQLKIECENLSRKIGILQQTNVGFFALSLATLLFSDNQVLNHAAGFLGSISLYNIIQEYLAGKLQKDNLRKSDFYIPFLIQEQIEK